MRIVEETVVVFYEVKLHNPLKGLGKWQTLEFRESTVWLRSSHTTYMSNTLLLVLPLLVTELKLLIQFGVKH